MYKRVKANDVVFNIVFRDVQDVDVKDWRRVEGLVRSIFITMCADRGMEVSMITDRDIEMLRFFIEWEIEKKGRDMKVNIGGREFVFRKCRISSIDIRDFKTYYDGDALSITIGMTHSGIAVSG